jgi:hypothetical protein
MCKQSSIVRHYDKANKKASRNYPIYSYKTWHSVSLTMRDSVLTTVRHDNKMVPRQESNWLPTEYKSAT